MFDLIVYNDNWILNGFEYVFIILTFLKVLQSPDLAKDR